MKKKYTLLVLCLLFVSAGALFVKYSSDNNSLIDRLGKSPNKELEVLLAKKEKLGKEKGRALTEDEALSLLPAKARNYLAAGDNFNKQAMTFYGQVIDQHSMPVVDAKVHLGLGGGALSGGSFMQLKTDAKGRFAIEGVQGSFLQVRGIEANNIETIRHYLPSGKTTSGRIFYGFQPNTSANELLWKDHTTPDKAYVFKVWRKGVSEGVVQNSAGRMMKNYEQWYTVDLLNDELYIDDKEGHLRIRAWAEPADGRVDNWGKPIWRYPRDWWVEIEPINASLQVVPKEDVFFNLAPENGYSSKVIRFAADKRGNDYQDRVKDMRYYLKAHNGSYYGYIYIDVIKPITRSGMITFRYEVKLNPNGSRNLEYHKNLKTGS